MTAILNSLQVPKMFSLICAPIPCPDHPLRKCTEENVIVYAKCGEEIVSCQGTENGKQHSNQISEEQTCKPSGPAIHKVLSTREHSF